MIKSIVYASFSLAVAIDIDSIAASSSSSSSHYLQSSPVIQNHIHQNVVHRTLRDLHTTTHHQNNNNNQQQQYERFTQDTATNESCPGTAMLWKINNIETGKHVGFGVGTMHLPKDVVLTQGSYDSILAAIAGMFLLMNILIYAQFCLM